MIAFFDHVQQALACTDIDGKLARVHALELACRAGAFELHRDAAAACHRGVPSCLKIVAPQDLPTRRIGAEAGLVSLLHAVAHIEYTAIDLALDHACAFREFPDDYYPAWIGVAAEEAVHFALLRERLRHHGRDYGDIVVHDSLWDMAERTRHDALARMALVPRLMEARGLDATPQVQDKLRRAGDLEAVRVLDVVLRDEVGHVALGDRWFRWLCARRGIPAEATFRELIAQYQAPWPANPMNEAARLAAGFSAAELADLKARRL